VVVFNPDGHSFLSASMDGTAQLWDAGTGMPLGRVIAHGASVTAAAFSPDGRDLLTASQNKTARLWHLPDELPDNLEWATALVETTTGLQLDERGSLHNIDRAGWNERWELLRQLGGPEPGVQPRRPPRP
jgi:WD40 repeat protein